jgi:hypothetical protein
MSRVLIRSIDRTIPPIIADWPTYKMYRACQQIDPNVFGMSSYRTSLFTSSANDCGHVYRYICLFHQSFIVVLIAVEGGALFTTDSRETEDKVTFL